MIPTKDIVIAFDLYGTLLSTESISQRLEVHFGQAKAESVAATWRKYQLEYTWRLNCIGKYEPFSNITRRSLQHVLKEFSLSLAEAEIDNIMKEYDSLSTFPDVSPALSELGKHPGFTAVIFSNGTSDMVSASVYRSPDLSPYAEVFKELIVVGDVKKFKPDPIVYHMLATKVHKENAMEDLWLVSGNPFDIVGARCAGMSAVWVDRVGTGWVDSLVEGELGKPTIIIRRLDDLVDSIKKHLNI